MPLNDFFFYSEWLLHTKRFWSDFSYFIQKRIAVFHLKDVILVSAVCVLWSTHTHTHV